MYGFGLVLFNPPWTLQAQLTSALPYLAEHLGQGSWEMEWRSEEGGVRS
jgi:23S rRNA (adenine2030-N6)-methyltransferase